MKKMKGLLAGLLAMALLLVGLPMYGMEAKAAQSGDYEYETWYGDGGAQHGGVAITKYVGSGGDVVVPSELNGEEVTNIGFRAFRNCSGLTSVEIPSSVIKIDRGAFGGCSSLESLKVSEGNAKYDSRENCNGIIETASNTLVLGCKNTKIPSSMTGIWGSAFEGCIGLISVEIPSSVTEIGSFAFEGCIGLTSVEIPFNVTEIDESAFWGCSSLESLKVSEGNAKYDSRENCNGIIETASNTLVAGCKNTKIPSSVTEIGDSAFSGCIGLTSVEIPSSVTEIGDYVFYGCIGLTSVEIPSSVTNIGFVAFRDCIGLTSVEIPSSVTELTAGIFGGCSSLESLKVSEGNAKYDSRENCNGIIETASNTLVLGCKNTKIPSSVTEIGSSAFSGCIGLTSVEIPSSVTEIGSSAFSGCIGLTSVEIPSSVTGIGGSAFSGCIGLTSMEIPSSVTRIGGSAFSGCIGLTSVEIPSSVTEIGDSAFSGCTGLTSVEIPSSVTEIGDSAFSGCTGLTSVAIPPSMTGIGYGTFSDCSENLIIIGVPGSEAEKYAQSHGIAFNPVEDISKAAITLEKDSYIYDGKPKTPAVSVELGGKTLAPNTDYTVSYQDNINAGTAKVAVEGKGNYIGSAQKEFTIKKADTPAKGDISEASITLERVSYTYDGKPKGPAVTVKLGGKTLAPNTDYTVSYSDNINVGTAKAAVTGKGGYTGSKSAAFAIVEATGTGQPAPAITCKKTLYKVTYGAKPFKVKATSASRLSFTSNKPKVAAVGKDTGEVAVKGAGVAEITVKAGKESVKVTVQVSPKRPSLKSAKAAKGRKLTVRWAKDRMAAGYQVQVSTSKAFKKDVKSKKLAKASHTFTKLKAGKKYYVRVRSYKGALRSAWSKVKQSGKVKR